jgi:hypothetical protein
MIWPPCYHGRGPRPVKRGTLILHPRYGLCSVGGCDRQRSTFSLHAYRTNKRLTQTAKEVDLVTLTWTPYRSYLVSEAPATRGLKPLKRSPQAGSLPPTAKAGASPHLKARIL